MADTHRPEVEHFVHIACFCEDASFSDQRVLTISGVAGQLLLQQNPPLITIADGRIKPHVQLNLKFVLSITPLPMGLAHQVVFDLEFVNPDGSVGGTGLAEMNFGPGDGNGLQILDATLELSQLGIHWMNVRLNKKVLTRVALNVLPQPGDAVQPGNPVEAHQQQSDTSRQRARKQRRPRSDASRIAPRTGRPGE